MSVAVATDEFSTCMVAPMMASPLFLSFTFPTIEPVVAAYPKIWIEKMKPNTIVNNLFLHLYPYLFLFLFAGKGIGKAIRRCDRCVKERITSVTIR